MPVAGSVTSKPSTSSAASCGRVPSMCSRPSGPRTTDGSIGSASFTCWRADGSRSSVFAASVWPTVASVGAAASAGAAVTVVVSLTAASDSTMRPASDGGTVTGWNPGRDTTTCSLSPVPSSANEPSAPVTVEATVRAPARSSTVAPGTARPVWSTTRPWIWPPAAARLASAQTPMAARRSDRGRWRSSRMDASLDIWTSPHRRTRSLRESRERKEEGPPTRHDSTAHVTDASGARCWTNRTGCQFGGSRVLGFSGSRVLRLHNPRTEPENHRTPNHRTLNPNPEPENPRTGEPSEPPEPAP